jgi:hypothetical protein
MKEDKPLPKHFFPGDKRFAGQTVQFTKSGSIYKVGPGGNLINPNKTKMSKKQRRRRV